MPAIISTLCTCLLLTLSWKSAAQSADPVEGRIGCSLKDGVVKEEPVQFVCSYVQEICPIAAPPSIASPPYPAPEPPPPPPPPCSPCSPCSYYLTPEEGMLFKIVEEMPRFPGCESLITAKEKKQCSDRKMLEFLYRNITYPALARENCVEGTVVVQFVIEQDGSVTNGKVVRDIGAHCGEEALRVVNLMNEQGLKWVPGKQRGCAVRVQFNLPIRFRIECPDTLQPAVSEEPAPGPNVQEEKMETAGEALPPTEATPSGTLLTFEPEDFRLFPNPATDWLNVHFQAAPGPITLSIVNTSGQVLWKQEYKDSGGLLAEQIGLYSLPSGAYLLCIQKESAVYTHSFIKRRHP